MSLKKYQAKRNFNKTSEPKGRTSAQNGNLYLIQKHAASHLHYDFRLELNGVLKSWAIPKGPCLDPSVKRLAMHVEDHPIEYGSFEGVIPKGEYGGGTVMLWDTGSWNPLDDKPQAAYQKGHLRFIIKAHKLKGRWDLIRFKDDQHWFLIKYRDEYAQPLEKYDIINSLPNSVKSKKSLQQITNDFASSTSKENEKQFSDGKRKKKNKIRDFSFLVNLKPKPFPKKLINASLSTLVDTAPKGDKWLHEIKYDGYRLLTYKNKNLVTLRSRNQKDWTEYFPDVVSELKKLPCENCILDGEIVLLDEKQRSNFQLLQNSIKTKNKAPFLYYLFDIIYYQKYDLHNLVLTDRKKILQNLIKDSDILRYSDHIKGSGRLVFKKSCEAGLEGIISKQVDSYYLEKRTKQWLKVKCIKRQEFIIIGYLKPKITGREFFQSLLLAVYDDKQQLTYCGNVGTGFDDNSLQTIFTNLQKYVISKNPYQLSPPNIKQVVWVKPKLVCEVAFSQWTEDGRLRHPSFQALRIDKDPKLITKEQPLSINIIEAKTDIPGSKKKVSSRLSNPNKILYPEDNFTKYDLFEFYDNIADYILPYIKYRPLTLLRCPDNYNKCFYQKHFTHSSKHLKSILIKAKEEEYIYLNTKSALLELVQMGVLEIHPWGSTIKNIEVPDLIIFDLDPGPQLPWKQVVKAAFDAKDILDQYNLTSFIKTTGGKGLHLVIPIKPEYDWEVIKKFSYTLVIYLSQKNPQFYVSQMAKSKRTGKVFIDYLRNQIGATAIAPYSTRARIHAPVAVPIFWDELTNNINDTWYNIKSLPKRLSNLKDDPWGEFFKIRQSLSF